ncbi:molybdopterin cofactor-binding domain-containing protein [Streptomyces sp. NPDC048516]|uniref:molybdopterin cofactor-binding domain-containing protein n=1 Tax=Streptomyces sp. NPDC048516 TaxID=3365565 RepID=UPI0037224000
MSSRRSGWCANWGRWAWSCSAASRASSTRWESSTPESSSDALDASEVREAREAPRPPRRPNTSARPGSRSATTSCTKWPPARRPAGPSARRPVGTVEFGEGTSTAHVQIAANQLGTTPSRIRLVQSDTDRTGFDTGGFASAGLFVAGNAVLRAAHAVRDRVLESAAAHTGEHLVMCQMDDGSVRCGERRVPLAELAAAARARGIRFTAARACGIRFTAARKAYGSPRSVTANTQGFCIAVHRMTGEIRILCSVQATDAAVLINPAQVRGQVEGGVAQARPGPGCTGQGNDG